MTIVQFNPHTRLKIFSYCRFLKVFYLFSAAISSDKTRIFIIIKFFIEERVARILKTCIKRGLGHICKLYGVKLNFQTFCNEPEILFDFYDTFI